mgnify:CR=1 FL=1
MWWYDIHMTNNTQINIKMKLEEVRKKETKMKCLTFLSKFQIGVKKIIDCMLYSYLFKSYDEF